MQQAWSHLSSNCYWGYDNDPLAKLKFLFNSFRIVVWVQTNFLCSFMFLTDRPKIAKIIQVFHLSKDCILRILRILCCTGSKSGTSRTFMNSSWKLCKLGEEKKCAQCAQCAQCARCAPLNLRLLTEYKYISVKEQNVWIETEILPSYQLERKVSHVSHNHFDHHIHLVYFDLILIALCRICAANRKHTNWLYLYHL